jgi:hypothetical protein
LRDKIEEKLKELGEAVFYGSGKFKGRDIWDCIVYGKRRIKRTGTSGRDYSHIWFVAIVKEESIPDGLELKVIEKMREAGVKIDSDAEYAYTDKSGECMVEICTMEFSKCVKGCA